MRWTDKKSTLNLQEYSRSKHLDLKTCRSRSAKNSTRTFVEMLRSHWLQLTVTYQS